MAAYGRILAAIDLTDDSRAVAGRAVELARAAGGSAQLLHVVEFIPIESMNDSLIPVVQLDEEMTTRARTQIVRLAQELALPEGAGTVLAGNPKAEILRFAREQSIELIVIGSRERHGLSILIQRTEDSVLHGAPCDVLAVRTR